MYRDNWHALQAFLSCSTQWRTIGGRVAGLDYPAVKAGLDMLQIEINPTDMMRIQILERATLRELGRRHG